MEHQMMKDELLRYMEVDQQGGLTMKQVQERQQLTGANELTTGEKQSWLVLFVQQFKDFMVVVLLGATIISGLLGEYLDAITIIAIIFLNAILGFIQEARAEKSLAALKKLASPTTTVTRDGKRAVIGASQLVPGDMVHLESGDRIPADVRFIAASSCFVEESALTGESVAVQKHADKLEHETVSLGDLSNMGFMGTMMTRGTATAIVVRTGMNTEMGKIASLMQHTETMETPLQHRLAQLGKILITVALALTTIVVGFGIWHGQPMLDMFLTGVSLAVAAIPEGLPAIVTVALALGVQRMIKRRAIVRKLPSVETLGSASVICSDKTGTLTTNKMTVTKLWLGGRTLDVTGEGYEPVGAIYEAGQVIDVKQDLVLRRLLQIAALCNNAKLERTEQPEPSKRRKKDAFNYMWTMTGDATEGALVVLAAKMGMDHAALASLYARQQEYPFDAQRKRMSVLVQHQGGRLVCTKGAPDMLIEQCAYILWDGKVMPFTATLKQKVQQAAETMAEQALRVLGFAYRDLRPQDDTSDEAQVECQLIFVGLAGIIDPPRQEVQAAIATCRRAGIKTVMITGDHLLTAEAIATTLGILPKGGKALTGQRLNDMTDEQLDREVEHTYVYARVSPEHKLRVVKSLQKAGHIVAMTGDGVNDAPAIKAADIGIAMGQTGTDVAKEASSLILSDDNFSTIVAAIEEGRSIYENIRKFIRYLLASNVGEIMTMLLAMVVGLPLPLVPIQILWVNLVTDGLPAIALGVDQAEKDLMQQKPRHAKENIFARRLGWKIVSRGIAIGVCTLIAFWLTWRVAPGDAAQLVKAQTVAFATLVMAQLIHVFDCRSSRSIFHRNLLQNKYLVLAVLSSLALMVVVLYYAPLQPIFKTVPLHFRDWCLVLVAAGIPTFALGIGSVFSTKK